MEFINSIPREVIAALIPVFTVLWVMWIMIWEKVK